MTCKPTSMYLYAIKGYTKKVTQSIICIVSKLFP